MMLKISEQKELTMCKLKEEQRMNMRERRFAYCYVLDPETKGNAEQSAIKAGYSPRYARGNAHKLVARSCIVKRISELEQEIKVKLTVSLEQKIQEARENYLHYKQLGKDLISHRWFEEHGKLASHYVQKVEQKIQVNPEESLEIESMKKKLELIEKRTLKTIEYD